MRTLPGRLLAGASLLLLAACGEKSILPSGSDVGLQPVIKEPVKTTIPTVDIAPAPRAGRREAGRRRPPAWR